MKAQSVVTTRKPLKNLISSTKTNVVVLLALCLSASACKKDSGNTNTSTSTGSYTGSMNVFVNGVAVSTLLNKTVVLSPGTGSTDLTLQTGVIFSTSGNISSNGFTIPKHTVSSTAYFNVIEYGIGTFSNNTLVVDFHQDQVSPATNAVLGTGEWTGTLIKQ
jgi:hypothetical protein